MSLVSKSVTGLVQGVSQQTAMSRSETQLDYQLNAISSAVRGLGKRPGTFLSASLGNTQPNALWHFIDRDATERYISCIDPAGNFKVWDLEGNEKSVKLIGSAKDYIKTNNPKEDLRLVTMNDYTFVVNKKKVVDVRTDIDSDVIDLEVLSEPGYIDEEATEFRIFVYRSKKDMTGALRQYCSYNIPSNPDSDYAGIYYPRDPSSEKMFYTWTDAINYYRRLKRELILSMYPNASDFKYYRYRYNGPNVYYEFAESNGYTFGGAKHEQDAFVGTTYETYREAFEGTTSYKKPQYAESGVYENPMTYREDYVSRMVGERVTFRPDPASSVRYTLPAANWDTPTTKTSKNTDGSLDVTTNAWTGTREDLDINLSIVRTGARGSARKLGSTTPNELPIPTGYTTWLSYVSGFRRAGIDGEPVINPVQPQGIYFTLDGAVVSIKRPGAESKPLEWYAQQIVAQVNAQLPSYTATIDGTKVNIKSFWYPYMDYHNYTDPLIMKSTYQTVQGARAWATKDPDRVYIVIKQGVAEQTYRVSVNGREAQYTTGTTDQYATYRADRIAQELANDLNLAGGLQATVYGRLIVVAGVENVDLTFDYYDTWNGQAMYAMKNRVQAFSDLPASFIEGRPVEVVGEGGTEGYYVRYTKAQSIDVEEGNQKKNWRYNSMGPVSQVATHVDWQAREGEENGTWEECARGWMMNFLSASTMPHALVRKEDGSFELCPLKWAPRRVGDTKSAPAPSFVGQTIKDLFFWRGRMGLLSNDSLVMSKSGSFFDFWPSTAKDVLDNDPIDVDVTLSKPAELLFGIPFNTSLLIFSNQGQFQVTANGTLTARTISVQPTLEYQVSSRVRPVNVGEAVLFASERGQNMTLFETEVLPNQFLTSATDVTLHVPNFIDTRLEHLTANNVTNIVVGVQNNSDTLKIYQYLYSGDQKVQEAWHEWKLPGVVLYAEFVSTRLWLVIKKGQTTELLWLETQENFINPGYEKEVYTDRTTCVGNFITGDSYEMKFRLSPIYMRNQDGKAIPDAILKLRNITFHQTDATSSYTVKVSNKMREPKLYPYGLGGKRHRVPVLGDSRESVIEVTNDTMFPCFFTGYTYEGELVMRTRKV